MSRIRTIKPEFFLDEELAELTPLTRLLFIGLWTLADCEGRLEDRPKRIRAQLHPYDDGDTNAMLADLEKGQFIFRYLANDTRYIQIRTFKKHQRLTAKEGENKSTIPPRPEEKGDPHDPGYDPGMTQVQPGYDPGMTQIQPDDDPEHTKVVHGTPGREYGVWERKGGWEGKGREHGKGRDSPAARPTPTHKTSLPTNLAISPETRTWASEHGYQDLEHHLESFKDKAIARGYQYADWQAALRNAIRDDWAGLRKATPTHHASPHTAPATPEGARFAEILNHLTKPALEGELIDAIH